MTPQQLYKQNSSLGWTRIDMLLFIYDRTIGAIQEGIDRLEQSEVVDLTQEHLRAQHGILLLIDGLTPESDPVAEQVLRLCHYILGALGTVSVTSWSAALRVLRTLRDGFAEIADDCRIAERGGTVAPLRW